MRPSLLATVLLLTAVPAAQAQFVQYSFTGAAGSEATFPPDAQPAGATASPMRRGTGLTPSSADGTFSASGFPTAAARDTADYFAFTITPDAGGALTYTRLTLDERRSGTGPRTWALYTSVDGYTTPVAVVDVPDNTDMRLNTEVALGEGFAGVGGPVTFRLYAYAAEATPGTWRLDNVRLDASMPVSGPSIRFGTAPTSVAEAAPGAALVLLLTEPSATEPTTVRLRVTGGTATAGQDYRVADTLLTVPAGATRLDVAFPLRDDAEIEPDETVVLALESPSRGVLAPPTTFTLTLVDDDRPTTVRFADAELVAGEDAGALSLALVREGPASGEAATVRITFGGGTATPGQDFDLPAADVAFAAGQATAFATLPLYQDLEAEGEETAVLGLQIVAGTPRLQVGTPGTLTLRIREQAANGAGTICPGQVADALRACLRSAYSRTTVVSYDQARTYLYGEFYPGPPYTGVYTGRTGPRGGGGSTTELDTEHTWPQSMMPDQGSQVGEMHNLFPTISKVNNDRGNLPFGEIADTLATGWYCPTGTLPQAAPPDTGRELCSEIVGGVRFEPREDHKGNVARALAYFATVYTATATSTAFLREVQPILVAWNRLDPPDDAERARSAFIRTKQGNDNPYILDTTLVRRAFAFATGTGAVRGTALALSLAPSPTRGVATLTGTVPGPARVHVSVFDALGRRVLVLPPVAATEAFSRTLDAADLAPGVYFVHVRGEGPVPFARTLPLVRAR